MKKTMVTQSDTDFSDKHILLAEDIELNRIILTGILEPMKIEIVEAENGQEAVDIFKRLPVGFFDLIFMDVQMPVMNGYEATRQIRALDREDAKKIPIIAMTANTYKEDVDRCIEAGMNGHLEKPLDTAALHNTLKLIVN